MNKFKEFAKNIYLCLLITHCVYRITLYIYTMYSTGIKEKYVSSIILEIILIICIIWQDNEIKDKKHKKLLNKKRKAKIDNIYNELAEQDKYLNKQIVTRQYREQKSKKDGK